MNTGKKGAQHNAMKHGIFAGIIMRGPGSAEPEEFQRLLAGAREAIRPANGLEDALVEKLAALLLRLSRVYKADLKFAPKLLSRVTKNLKTESMGLDLALDDDVVNSGLTLDSVIRYETSIERQIGRTLSQIQQLRRMREINIEPVSQNPQPFETQTSLVPEDPELHPDENAPARLQE